MSESVEVGSTVYTPSGFGGKVVASDVSEGVAVVAVDWGDGLEDWVQVGRLVYSQPLRRWVVPPDA